MKRMKRELVEEFRGKDKSHFVDGDFILKDVDRVGCSMDVVLRNVSK